MQEEAIFDDLVLDSKVSKEKPCGCNEKMQPFNIDPFSGEEITAPLGDLSLELDAALAGLSTGQGSEITVSDMLTPEEEFEFASLEAESGLKLQDILTFAERNPGLKITFSF